MKVNELSGLALDYWACRAALAEFQGQKLTPEVIEQVKDRLGSYPFHPSTDWATAGPIIERERIAFVQVLPHLHELGKWWAVVDGTIAQGEIGDGAEAYGDTQLVAAMRAFVASRFGDEVPHEDA